MTTPDTPKQPETEQPEPPAAESTAPEEAQQADKPPIISSPMRLLTTAIFLGLSVDVLFYKHTLGISFVIFIGLMVLALLLVALFERVRPAAGSLWLALPIVGLAAMVAVRAEPMTTLVNVLVVLALGVLWVINYRASYLWQWGLFAYGFNLIGTLFGIPLCTFDLLSDARTQAQSSDTGRQVWLPLLRGILIALPLLLIFTALFRAADLVFADRLTELLEQLNLDDFPDLVAQSMIIVISTLILLGLLGQTFHSYLESVFQTITAPTSRPFLGIIESGVILGSITALFAAFVVIQFQYLFSPIENIQAAGYSYSEYARRGFGELVTVVAATLGLLLFLGHFSSRESAAARNTFNLLNVVMVALVGVIVASALRRLLIYETVYGFTRLRTYSHVAIIWLGILFAPYLIGLLARRMHWFAGGSVLVVIGFAITLNVVDVDRFIVENNYANRRITIDGLDTGYLLTLSPDAVPALINLMHESDLDTQMAIGPGLACQRALLEIDQQEAGWQSQHYARTTALQLLQAQPALDNWVVEVDEDGIPYIHIGDDTQMCWRVLSMRRPASESTR